MLRCDTAAHCFERATALEAIIEQEEMKTCGRKHSACSYMCCEPSRMGATSYCFAIRIASFFSNASIISGFDTTWGSHGWQLRQPEACLLCKSLWFMYGIRLTKL